MKMEIALGVVLSLMAFEGFIFALFPETVKFLINELPRPWLIAAGAIEFAVAGMLMVFLLAGKL